MRNIVNTKWEIIDHGRNGEIYIGIPDKIGYIAKVYDDEILSESVEDTAKLIASAPKLKRDRDKLLEAGTKVLERLNQVCIHGGSIKDFLAFGSMREIVEAIAQAESEK